MSNPGRWRDHDPRPGDLGSPAEVQVLTEQLNLRIEAAKCPEQVRAHQGAGARYREHLSDLVVLSLVELARLDPLEDPAEAVDAEPDLEQTVGSVPFDELRADYPSVGPVGLLDQAANRIRCRSDVVVADQQVRCSLDRRKRLVRGCREAAVVILADDEGARKNGRDAGRQLLAARGVHDQHVEVRVVLSGKRLQASLEPQGRVGSDHHGDDRRDLLLGHHRGRNPTATTRSLRSKSTLARHPRPSLTRCTTSRRASNLRAS